MEWFSPFTGQHLKTWTANTLYDNDTILYIFSVARENRLNPTCTDKSNKQLAICSVSQYWLPSLLRGSKENNVLLLVFQKVIGEKKYLIFKRYHSTHVKYYLFQEESKTTTLSRLLCCVIYSKCLEQNRSISRLLLIKPYLCSTYYMSGRKRVPSTTACTALLCDLNAWVRAFGGRMRQSEYIWASVSSCARWEQ